MNWLKILVAATTLTAVVGCTVHEEVAAGYPAPGPGVVVEPGYYYDADYYDVYGVYHPAFYYYYDGHHYYHRDYAPGYAFRARPGFAPPHGYRPGPAFGGGGEFHGGGGPHGR